MFKSLDQTRLRIRLLLGALALLIAVGPGASAIPSATTQTEVTISGEDFYLDGSVTYEGRTSVPLPSGGTADLEGTLLNVRAINGVFDDDNGGTRANWNYPFGPAEPWGPDRNVDELLAMLPAYRQAGLLMLTVGLQGGNPASASAAGNGSSPSWVVSAYNADGSLKPAWLGRLARVVEAADALGMAINLSLFYQRQEHRLMSPTNEAAAKAGVDNVTDWLVERGYRNVIVSIQNEVGSSLWQSGIWKTPRAHELIERAKARHPSLIVGTGMRDVLPTEAILEASDYVAFSANSMTATETESFIDDVRSTAGWSADPKPILVIEDGPRPSGAEMDAALRSGVSFGYHDDGPRGEFYSNYEEGFQWVPVDWTISTSSKRDFFDRVAAASGSQSTPPGGSSYELLVSGSPDRSGAAGLAGASLADDVYVFVGPEAGVEEVSFYLDDSDMSGSLVQRERSAPFDFRGTGDDGSALPFETAGLADGAHSVTARVSAGDGSVEVTTASFTVSNAGTDPEPALELSPEAVAFEAQEGGGATPSRSLEVSASTGSASFTLAKNAAWLSVSPTSGSTPASVQLHAEAAGLEAGTYTATVTATATGYLPASATVTLEVAPAPGEEPSYELLVSGSADRSAAVGLAGASLAREVFVFVSPEAGVDEVRFYLDDLDTSGSPFNVELNAPWDLAGTDRDDRADPFDTARLSDGSHTVTAEVIGADGAVVVITAEFGVAND